jgi:Tfp pilus assembly protein FimT
MHITDQQGCGSRHHNGFTVAELLIILLILGAVAYIAVPRLQWGAVHYLEAKTVARKLVTDLRRTRSLALRDGATNTQGFALRMTGSTPYTSYELIDLSNDEVIDTHTIDANHVEVRSSGGRTFQFGPLGNVVSGSGTRLTVTGDGQSFTLTLVPATGSVFCSED